MPGAACLRVHAEGQQLALAVVRVGVAAGADRGEADDLLTGAGDEQLVPRLGGVASDGRQTRAKAGPSKRSSTSGERVAAYASRQTAACTRPTAGASPGRAIRTLASATGAPPPWSWTSSDAAERGVGSWSCCTGPSCSPPGRYDTYGDSIAKTL